MELHFVLYFSSQASFGCEDLKGKKNKMNGKLPSFEVFGCCASPSKCCTFANMAVDCGCIEYLSFTCYFASGFNAFNNVLNFLVLVLHADYFFQKYRILLGIVTNHFVDSRCIISG